MDFKKKYPNYNIFAIETYATGRTPFPFDLTHGIEEYDAPGGGSFYGLSSFMSHDESFTVSYLTDSCSDCKMRHAFEYGEISWTDFWLSRPWLIRIELAFPICQNRSPARYINPQEMETEAMNYLKKMDMHKPLELKRRRLKDDIFVLRRFHEQEEVKLKEKELQDFEKDYGQFLDPKAA